MATIITVSELYDIVVEEDLTVKHQKLQIRKSEYYLHQRLMKDCLGLGDQPPRYIYRLSISEALPFATFICTWTTIVGGVVNNDDYFMQKSYTLGVMGLLPHQKITGALRMQACNVGSDKIFNHVKFLIL